MKLEAEKVKAKVSVSKKEVVKVVEVETPCTKCASPCEPCLDKIRVIRELTVHNENFRYDYRTMKEAYDKISSKCKNIKKANRELSANVKMLNATAIEKQKAINMYIKTIAEI